MKAIKQKKTDLFMKKASTFEFLRQKYAHEFQEKFMMCAFVIKLTQFEKNGLIDKTFISLGNLRIEYHFRNWKSIRFLVTFRFLLFDSGVCLAFNKGNDLN